MIRKVVLSALIISVAVVTGVAANSDNTTPNPSYFEGVWVGSWPSYLSPSTTQGITLNIDRGKKEDVFLVEYSWEAVEFRRGIIPAGSIKAKGREEGDRFNSKWQKKQGRDFEITLQKYKDNVVKARLDKSGPYNPSERPYTETFLNRK